MLAVKIDAGQDKGGNPRRGWIIFRDSGVHEDFVDEGYDGNQALVTAGYPQLVETATNAIPTTPAYYKLCKASSKAAWAARKMPVGDNIRRKGRYDR